jgi:hypothetical protein
LGTIITACNFNVSRTSRYILIMSFVRDEAYFGDIIFIDINDTEFKYIIKTGDFFKYQKSITQNNIFKKSFNDNRDIVQYANMSISRDEKEKVKYMFQKIFNDIIDRNKKYVCFSFPLEKIRLTYDNRIDLSYNCPTYDSTGFFLILGEIIKDQMIIKLYPHFIENDEFNLDNLIGTLKIILKSGKKYDTAEYLELIYNVGKDQEKLGIYGVRKDFINSCCFRTNDFEFDNLIKYDEYAIKFGKSITNDIRDLIVIDDLR